MKQKVLRPLDHKVLSEVRPLGLSGAMLLLGVSGGIDSLALACIFNKLAPLLQVKVCVCYVHHGWVQGTQITYRNKAWKHVKKISEDWGWTFYSNLKSLGQETKLLGLEIKPLSQSFHRRAPQFVWAPEAPLKSEEEMRNFRNFVFANVKKQLELDSQKVYVTLAHNSNDLLETRLIRMIRGTGLQGLKSMELLSGEKFRPLLNCDREELRRYLELEGIRWVDDPSNQAKDPLRNWIRNEWLPQLEQKRQGALLNMSRSFLQMSQAFSEENFSPDSCIHGNYVSHSQFIELNVFQKQQVLAAYMRTLNMKDYSQGHIKEILKRLDSSQKQYTFSILRHTWTVTPQKIEASPVS